ncbi:MAG: substrate-binding domain-containing protein [Thermoproteota archaeon]
MSNGRLHVYSAGAVAPPVKKVAEQFRVKQGIDFEFTVGKAEELISEITELEQGDVLTCGAEYIFDEAQVKGLILGESRRSVGYRGSVILVAKGNPKGIESISDLADDGINVGVSVGGCLLGVWDDVASKAGLIDPIRKNIMEFADGCGAVVGLINQKKVDAIIGWDAFQKLWPATIEVIDLPRELQVFRSTGIAVIQFSKQKETAKQFINYVTSEKGKKIYRSYGWIHKHPEPYYVR